MRVLVKVNRHLYKCLFIFFVFIYSCKEPDNVGLNVLPKSDLSSLSYSDTSSLQTSVVKEDSILATGNSANLVGAIHDDKFGDSKASFYTQVLLSSVGIDFGSKRVCDSIILTLAYSGYYGDTTAAHNFEVDRLNEYISSDSNYYSTKSFHTSDPLGTLTTSDIHPHDSVMVNGINTAPHLRFPLYNSDSSIFCNPTSNLYTTNSAFLSFFNGICIKDVSSPATGGSILYFTLTDTMSKITVYYNDSLSFSFFFPITTSTNLAETVNHFEHNNYSGAIFVNNFNDINFGKDRCYIQSMAGVKTKVEFPFLKNLVQNGNVSINKAEFTVTIDNTTTATYAAHSSLFLVGIDSAGKSFFLPDYVSSTATFGGAQNSGTYTFLVTRYIQQILSGKRTDYGLYLVAAGAAVNANRTVIGGSNNATFPMKLKLSYTNINP